MWGSFADRVVAMLCAIPIYRPLRKPKAALSEIVKHNPSKSREVEYLVHSGAIYPRVQRRLYKERDA